jgi:hypothetical protein
MGVRVLVSAGDAGKLYDLRCRVREAVIGFLAREYPQCLPRSRIEAEMELAEAGATQAQPAPR